MKGRKHSRQREAILAKIRSTSCHPTADWIFRELREEFPSLSLGTVYRNLVLFKEDRSIISVGNIEGQERFDGNMLPHGHFVCQKCAALIDIDLPNGSLKLSVNAKAVQGCKIERMDFTAYGTCSVCLEKKVPQTKELKNHRRTLKCQEKQLQS